MITILSTGVCDLLTNMQCVCVCEAQRGWMPIVLLYVCKMFQIAVSCRGASWCQLESDISRTHSVRECSEKIILSRIDELTFWIDLSMCESNGRGVRSQSLQFQRDQISLWKALHVFEISPFSPCVPLYCSLVCSWMENTTSQLEPVGIICIPHIWTDDQCLLKHAGKWWSFSFFFFLFGKGFRKEAVKQIWQER